MSERPVPRLSRLRARRAGMSTGGTPDAAAEADIKPPADEPLGLASPIDRGPSRKASLAPTEDWDTGADDTDSGEPVAPRRGRLRRRRSGDIGPEDARTERSGNMVKRLWGRFMDNLKENKWDIASGLIIGSTISQGTKYLALTAGVTAGPGAIALAGAGGFVSGGVRRFLSESGSQYKAQLAETGETDDRRLLTRALRLSYHKLSSERKKEVRNKAWWGAINSAGAAMLLPGMNELAKYFGYEGFLDVAGEFVAQSFRKAKETWDNLSDEQKDLLYLGSVTGRISGAVLIGGYTGGQKVNQEFEKAIKDDDKDEKTRLRRLSRGRKDDIAQTSGLKRAVLFGAAAGAALSFSPEVITHFAGEYISGAASWAANRVIDVATLGGSGRVVVLPSSEPTSEPARPAAPGSLEPDRPAAPATSEPARPAAPATSEPARPAAPATSEPARPAVSPSPDGRPRLPSPGEFPTPRPRLPSPGEFPTPGPRGMLLPVDSDVLAQSTSGNNVFLTAEHNQVYLEHAAPGSIRVDQLPMPASGLASERFYGGITSGRINLEPLTSALFEADARAPDSVWTSPDFNDAVNAPPTEIFKLTEADVYSPASLGPDHEQWSSLDGWAKGQIGNDLVMNYQDPDVVKILDEIDEYLKTNRVFLFHPDIVDQIKAGQFANFDPKVPGSGFDPHNSDLAAVLKAMEQVKSGKQVFNRELLGIIAAMKMDNPEDPNNLGVIFHLKNADYFKHNIDLKTKNPLDLAAKLRKAA